MSFSISAFIINYTVNLFSFAVSDTYNPFELVK